MVSHHPKLYCRSNVSRRRIPLAQVATARESIPVLLIFPEHRCTAPNVFPGSMELAGRGMVLSIHPHSAIPVYEASKYRPTPVDASLDSSSTPVGYCVS